MTKKSREHEVIEVAARLFASKGYAETTMEDIASELGMLKGSLYYYVKSKHDLVGMVLGDAIVELGSGLTKVLESNSSYAEKLRCAFYFHIKYFHAHYPRTLLFLEHRYHDLPEVQRKQVKQARDHYEDLWRRLVLEGIERGEFRSDLDVTIVVRALLGMCNWMTKWYRARGKWGPDEIAGVFYVIASQGLRPVPCKAQGGIEQAFSKGRDIEVAKA